MSLPSSPQFLPSVLAGALLPAMGTSQSSAVGPYDAESFEAHRYTTGALAGTSYSNGQDGWILFDSLTYPPNLGAATVQTATVRSG